MNKILWILTLSVLLFSCNKDIVDIDDKDLVPEKVYFVAKDMNTDLTQTISYKDLGESSVTFNMWLYKSGIKENHVTAKIGLLTQAELAEYNAEFNKDFVMLDADAYHIKTTEYSFSGKHDDLSKMVEIEFDIEKLKSSAPNAVLALKISESSAEINPEKSRIILTPEMTDIWISFKDGTREFVYVDEGSLKEDIELSLQAILELAENKWDVEVELTVDADYVDEYNKLKSSSYSLLSNDKYTLETKNTIASGKTSTTFSLEIKKENIAKGGQYMLPIRLKQSSKFSVKKSDLYCIKIDITGAKLDRTGWEVVLFNTEDAQEKAYPRYILDGDLATYWQSKWKNGETPFPHYLVIDMKNTYTLEQMEMIQRQVRVDQTRTKDVELYMGDSIDELNGIENYTSLADIRAFLGEAPSWKKVASFTMMQTIESQLFPVTKTAGRYVMIMVTSGYSTTSSLAEVYPYGS